MAKKKKVRTFNPMIHELSKANYRRKRVIKLKNKYKREKAVITDGLSYFYQSSSSALRISSSDIF